MRDSRWTADVLEGYASRPVGEGTLVRPVDRVSEPRAAVLHVHGYNDYFFQTHLAEFFAAQGCAFHAVDLRRAGRSLRDGEIPHFATHLDEFGDDIADAADAVEELHPGLPLVVHAHSTGGLSTALWAADRPSPALRSLILDSPFLAMHGSLLRRAQFQAVPALARARPEAVLASHPSAYGAHLLRENGGRWEFDTAWKRPEGQPLRAAWFAAVMRGQARVARGLGLELPVLFARAGASGPDSPENPDLDRQDTVLDVAAMARRAAGLGSHVVPLVVDDAVHDLALSATGPRAAYLGGVAAWLDLVL